MALLNTSGFEQKKVGLAELAASGDPQFVLASGWLGSGLGLALYDPLPRVGGILHAVLPDSTADPGKAVRRPALFIDTGVAALLDAMLRLGAAKDRLRVALAGGAQILGAPSAFNVGQRNWDAALAALRQCGLPSPPQSALQQVSGRITLELATGEARLHLPGQARPLLLWNNSTATSTR